MAVGGYWQYAGATNPSRAYVFDLAGPTPTLPVATLTNSNPSYSDHFGVKIAMSGTRVVVPAMRDPTGATNAGAVYLYDLSSPTPGRPVLTLTNPSPAPEDMFGNAVALSGNRLLVGCASDDTGAADAGIVYVYDLGGASPALPVVTLTHPRPAAGNYFGAGAILTGTRAFVPARSDGAGGSAGGIVYAYDLASATPNVPSLVFTNPSPAAGDYFGSVASSGNYVVIGAFLDDTEVQDSGSVYVYDLSDASPTVPVAMLSRPVRASQQTFGYRVAIHDTTIVVGAPWDGTLGQYHGAAYVFDLRPALSLVASAPGLATLSWTPSNAPGFVLQYSDSVPPTNWVSAPSGAANPVTIVTTNAARFFRLAQP